MDEWDSGLIPVLATRHQKVVGHLAAVVYLGPRWWHWEVSEKREGTRWRRILETGHAKECGDAMREADAALVNLLAGALAETSSGSKP